MTHPDPKPAPRVQAFDWLRGLAVVVMIQTHALVLLRPDLHALPITRWIERVDGLVAPSFLFSAGFSLAFVQCRASIRDGVGAAARASLKRIGRVLAVATLVNAIWFPWWRRPELLLRVDILQCVALSLALAVPLIVALATRPGWLRWAALAVGLGVFFTSPLMEHINGPLSLLANSTPGWLDASTGSPFPLFPWAGYVFGGVSMGATLVSTDRERGRWAWFAVLASVGGALWLLETPLRAAYPPHNVWATNPSEAGQRLTIVIVLLAAMRWLETRGIGSTSRVALQLAAFGGASLSAYFFHEMLLFQHHVGFFSRLWRGALSWGEFAAALSLLITLTWLCVQAWPRVAAQLTLWAARLRAAS